MAGPLDGLNLGAPTAPATTQKQPSTAIQSGPLSGFDPSAQPATTTSAPSVPWFSLTGPDKIGEFFSKAGDTATFGLAAKAQDALGFAQGPHGETVAQQVENAGKDIGPYGSAGADALGYIAGPGELRVGEGIGKLIGSGLSRGIGENVASRVGGRMIGSGIEGTGATILGAAGHDQDLTPGDLLKSALISTATGALPGGAGERPTTPSTADLQTSAQSAFAPLKNKVYQAPDVGNVIDRTTTGMSAGDAVSMGSKLRDARDVMANEVANRPTVTADDIAKFSRELGNAAGGDDVKQRIAQQYVAALNKGVGSKTATDIAAANRASNIAKTSGEIEGWAADPSGAPKAVKSALENNPDFYKAQPGLFDALSAIGQKGGEPSLLAKLRDYGIRGAVGGGLGYGAGYLMGGNPGQTAVEGAMTGVVAPHVIKAAGSLPIRNSLLAAQHLNATGVPVSPGVYTPQWLQIPGMLARQGGYAAGASGAF